MIKRKMRRFAPVLLVVALLGMSLLIGCQKAENPGVGVPNPIEEMADIPALQAAAGFKFPLPGCLPAGYAFERAALIGGTLAEITYLNGEAALVYRVAEGDEDVSGDYNDYAEEKVEADGRTATLRMRDGAVYGAVWQKDGLSFSLAFSDGVAADEAIAVFTGIE